MSIIGRSMYLEQLWKHRWNGRVKIITGIRRCGKSFLLSNLFKARLLEDGVDSAHIIEVALDRKEHDALRNPTKLSNALNREARASTTDATVKMYLDALEDAFLFSKAQRWDAKGKRYFNYPMKHYASDLGLRNARLNFRQIEENHLMENAIYNERVVRGYSVDVGAVRFAQTRNGKKTDAMHEIDFVVNRGANKLYIQSAMSVDDPDKREREIAPLLKSGDFFRKIVCSSNWLFHRR